MDGAEGSRVSRLLVPWIHVDVPRLQSFKCLERVRDISLESQLMPGNLHM